MLGVVISRGRPGVGPATAISSLRAGTRRCRGPTPRRRREAGESGGRSRGHVGRALCGASTRWLYRRARPAAPGVPCQGAPGRAAFVQGLPRCRARPERRRRPREPRDGRAIGHGATRRAGLAAHGPPGVIPSKGCSGPGAARRIGLATLTGTRSARRRLSRAAPLTVGRELLRADGRAGAAGRGRPGRARGGAGAKGVGPPPPPLGPWGGQGRTRDRNGPRGTGRAGEAASRDEDAGRRCASSAITWPLPPPPPAPLHAHVTAPPPPP